MNILITGAAGFIGSHLLRRYRTKYFVYGVDSLTSYYDVALKVNRLLDLGLRRNVKGDYEDERSIVYVEDMSSTRIINIIKDQSWDLIIHLAAQPGVRESIDNPLVSLDNNIKIFIQLLEAVKRNPPSALLFASSSSVYSRRNTVPYSEAEDIQYPESVYGVMKRSMEEIAYLYASMYGMKILGMRYFTVYGPMGRPDMAYYKFLNRILTGEPLILHNQGKMTRDYTYIDDIIEATSRLATYVLQSKMEYDTVNIGTGVRCELYELIELLSNASSMPVPEIRYIDTHGENAHTLASTDKLKTLIKYVPSTMLASGIKKFSDWYLKSHATLYRM